MCGITGYISLNKEINHSVSFLDNAINSLNKRGPDNIGKYRNSFCELAHSRLSIIDTSSISNQPMIDSSNRYIIVFNGEIYNYKRLRKDLISLGYNFKTQSDTEVILYSYIHYKDKCVDMFDGFFAFCVYDLNKKRSFIARDRFGIKPLYYSLNDERILFASELKSLLCYPIEKNIDRDALNLYFKFNYIPAPYSILESCKKLLPGECVIIENSNVEFKKYYTYYPKEKSSDNYSKAKQKIENLLYSSVEKRMIADVPLGTFLSGGVDSSIISLIASRIKPDINTFSIGFPDEPLFDESKYAEKVAKHINSKHHTFNVTNKLLYQNLDEILDYMDEPFADSSALNVFLLSQQTRQHVTVALSGDGADELFSGYNKHSALFFADKKSLQNAAIKKLGSVFNIMPQSRNSKLGNLGRKLSKLSKGLNLNKEDRYLTWASFMSDSTIRSLTNYDSLINPIKSLKVKDFNDYLFADFSLVLPNDMLKKVDLMSMANSLEVRTPFLYHELVEYVFSLPESYKINSNDKKKILKDIYRKDMPENLFERNKHGFEVPLNKWYKKELKNYLSDKIFSNNFLVKHGYLEQEELTKMSFQLEKGSSGDIVLQTWALIVLEHWCRKNIF